MKRLFRVVCWLMAVCYFSGGTWAVENAGCELLQKTDTAVVNWTEGVLTATGKGAPSEAYHGDPQGQKMALVAAVENARKKLLEAIEQIPIDSLSTVGELVENNEAVLIELKEMVGRAEVIHQEYSTDGSVTVTIQMSMNGGFSQLVLPTKIKQIESIKPISPSSGGSFGTGEEALSETTGTRQGPYTGMIVDVRGIPITPCMAPRVCDENGKEVFGSAYASREFAVQYGMTGYLSDLDAATRNPRVADRPLIIKGLRTDVAGRTDIVVSNTDAARLRSAFENLAFLRQCRVLIVMDAQDPNKKG